MSNFRQVDTKSASLPAIVVTGAASGIGRATALLLDGKGYRVFAGVRKLSDGESLVNSAEGQLTPVLLEVTDAESIAEAVRQIDKQVGESGLCGLVNNAGMSVSSVLEFLDIEALRYQLEVNLIGTVAVTQAFLPAIRRGQGRILNVSSDSGLIATPFMAPYSISKFGVEAFSDALRRELSPFGIEVVIVEPGAIATPMWGKGVADTDRVRESMSPLAESLYGESYAKFSEYIRKGEGGAIAVERVAEVIHRGLTQRRPRARYQVGNDAKMARWMVRLAPTRLLDRLITSTFS